MSLLGLILWKNFIVKLRKPGQFAVELFIPIFFFLFLAALRCNVLTDINKQSVRFPRFKIKDLYMTLRNNNDLDHSGTYNIMYTPATNETDSFFKMFQIYADSSMSPALTMNNINIQGFADQESMIKYYHESDVAYFSIGIVFEELNKTHFSVCIRMPQTIRIVTVKSLNNLHTLKWETEHVFPRESRAGPRETSFIYGGEPSYYEQGFLLFQQLLIYAYVGSYHPEKMSAFFYDYQIVLGRMPYPEYKDDNYIIGIKFFLPLIFIVSFIYPVANLTKAIVTEKEQRFTSIAAMMGLNQSVQWIAHFVTAVCFNMFSVIIIVFLLKFPFVADISVLQHSSISYLLFWFIIFIFNCIAYSFLISTLFSDSNMAGVVAGATFFIGFLPYYHITLTYSSMAWFTKICFSFILTLNMSFGCMLLSRFESQMIGLQWSNIFDTPRADDGLKMVHLFMVQIFIFILQILLTLYISNVFPGQFGMPREWNYFMQKSYWTNGPSIKQKPATSLQLCDKSTSREKTKSEKKFETKKDHKMRKNILQRAVSRFKSTVSHIFHSSQASSSESSIAFHELSRVKNLYKTFDGGRTYSVNNLSMTFRVDEITILLGHNGAGKSTLMNMLCGMIVPTAGEITLFGQDIRNVEAIQRELGICLQFDVLFDDMTVWEHLYFYSVLKRVDRSSILKEITLVIDMLMLEPKTHALSKTLSGGMKRKLCVGIALIGGSRFVILDEPTSGMDVSARRFIWDLLLREKKDRVILMSTHFMEEADVLADKIAIMEAGQLKCFGTPMELKKKFGQGYLLSIGLQDKISPDTYKKVIDLITNSIEGARIITSISGELTFSLPESESAHFKKLFTILEKRSKQLAIVNFGISVSTIEEVFLNVGDFAKDGIKQANKCDTSSIKSEGSLITKLKRSSITFNSGWRHKIQICLAMLTKKQCFISNSYFFMFSLCVLPPFILTLSLLVNKDLTSTVGDSPKRVLDLEQFSRMIVHSYSDGNNQSIQLEELAKQFFKGPESKHFEFINEKNVSLGMIDNHLISVGRKNVNKFTTQNLFATKFEYGKDGRMIATGLFSNEPFHTAPIILNAMNTVILRSLLGNNISLQFSIHPMPSKVTERLDLMSFSSITEIQLCFALTFAVSLLMSSFVIIVVSELTSNFRHIQQISGLSLKCFWLTHYIVDYFYWIIGSACLAVVILIANIEPYNTVKEAAYILVSLSLLGIPALPFIYVLSFTVQQPTAGYVRISFYTCILGTVTFISVIILQIPLFQLQDFSLSIEVVLQYVLPIFTMPAQAFAIGKNKRAEGLCNEPILFFNKNVTFSSFCNNPDAMPGAKICCESQCGVVCFIERSFLSWSKPGSLQFIVGYLVQTALYWTILYIIEKNQLSFYCPFVSFKSRCVNESQSLSARSSADDCDVKREKDRILMNSVSKLAETDAMWVTGLTKAYGNFTAVDNIYFGVKKAECFGILGTNGAGKTTTFKMITGAESLTAGDIIINKMSVLHNMVDIYKFIGYCPQFNGLLEELTGRETLTIISRIRGITENLIQPQIDVLAKLFFFEKHIDKKVYTYSGGTKRKLSMACSIVGNPMVVFLDEPSTGVDPVSRRCLWNGVQALKAAGSSVVLTSHSMEECEALCNRLIIMVNARLRCLGSPLHLKIKFGSGHIIQIKCRRSTKRKTIRALCDDVMKYFGNKISLQSNHNRQLTFSLKTNDFPLSEIFGYIEELKKSKKYNIEDYSVGQTSLEKIFLSFAREQLEVNR